MLRLFIASIAFFAAWSWMRAGFTDAIAKEKSPSGSTMLLRGVVFLATLVWWLLAVTDLVGWIFGLAIVGGVTWFMTTREPKPMGTGPSSSPPPGDAGA